MSKTAVFTWNMAKIQQLKEKAILGLITMGYDIDKRAKSKAPVGVYPPKSGKTGGTLVNSIRVDASEEKNGTVYVIAGGTVSGYNVPYAKRREFENRSHPSTTHYLGYSFEDVVEDYPKYFKGITE